MNVLISAFAFSPYGGSESAVGWQISKELARLHNVTVLFGDVWGNQKSHVDIVRYCGDGESIKIGSEACQVFYVDGMRAVYVAPSRLISFLTRLHKIPGLWMLYYCAYNLWQRKAFRVSKSLCSREKFDVVHQLTMIGYREPGYLWLLGIPFLWGPVGGGPNEPLAYLKDFSFLGKIRVLVRALINEYQKRMCFRAKRAARVAKKIWTVTSADYEMVSKIWMVPNEQLVETGCSVLKNSRVRSWDGMSPLRIVWSGLHIPRKELPILLKAVKGLPFDYRIDVLGSGAETEHWMSLADRLSIADRIVWHGALPRENAMNIMNDCHLLVFPSIKEGTPHVVLEALSLGLPVICHDACGMGTAVDERCGLKIPLCSPSVSEVGFRNALKKMGRSPELIEKLSVGAIIRAQELSWEKKVECFSKAYDEARI